MDPSGTGLSITAICAIAALAVCAVMGALWLIGRARDNYSLVDLGWAANFVVLAGLAGALAGGDPLRRALICGMYGLWSLRLAAHLARRIIGQPEEGRYRKLRADWAGPALHARFLLFFGAQGALNLILVLPLMLAVRNGAPQLHPFEIAAFILWAVALSGESLADRQLARFKRNPANSGKVCEQGLWNLSRHPNYFFECCIWVAYALFALASPWGWLALTAPAIMIYLLIEVTGVRPTEEQAVASRGDLYRDYQRRVSRLIPWPRGGSAGTGFAMRALETGLVPDVLIRRGIRRLLAQRLEEEGRGTLEDRQSRHMRFIAELRTSPVAIHTQAANEQHYEVPAEFFTQVLGPNLKYSSAYYDAGVADLGVAEERMLAITVERAGLRDGEDILELGCGWGSLTLYMARRFPASRITAVSNSHSQRNFILARAAQRGLHNVEVITCDVNVLHFAADRRFDRIVSVEMFEHLRNYEQLFARIGSWLRPQGTLFVHIFTHREFAYPFEVRDASDFMARHFFTGGLMPSDDLLLYFQGPLSLREHWQVDGTHYQKTAEAWLTNMDRARADVMPVFERVYGTGAARRWWIYWRVFFMSCAELWGYAGGREWLVSHYLFERRAN
jgi:cyclopropane-fatty-acyl-phospholipid synthase